MLANVGLVVAHSKHHLHAYYVIRNSELAGLTDGEIEVIAQIARYHRKSEPKQSHPAVRRARRRRPAPGASLAAVLRVAIGLDRRHERRVAGVGAEPWTATVALDDPGARRRRLRHRPRTVRRGRAKVAARTRSSTATSRCSPAAAACSRRRRAGVERRRGGRRCRVAGTVVVVVAVRRSGCRRRRRRGRRRLASRRDVGAWVCATVGRASVGGAVVDVVVVRVVGSMRLKIGSWPRGYAALGSARSTSGSLIAVPHEHLSPIVDESWNVSPSRLRHADAAVRRRLRAGRSSPRGWRCRS